MIMRALVRKSDTLRVVVLGVGNPLMADDGAGIEAVQRLQSRWTLPDGVHCVDGGTWGMALLPEFDAADVLIVLDAIECGRTPGTLVRISGENVPRRLPPHVSPHEINLHELFALAELRGTMPGMVVALGVQPQLVDWEVGLTVPVAAAIDRLADAAAMELRALGYAVERRTFDGAASTLEPCSLIEVREELPHA
ncbi:HyaD/HybD family hydrogenase maturation endopeptidase [Gemmatimonas sp.]